MPEAVKGELAPAKTEGRATAEAGEHAPDQELVMATAVQRVAASGAAGMAAPPPSARSAGSPLSPVTLLYLQRSVGNTVARRLVQREDPKPGPAAAPSATPDAGGKAKPRVTITIDSVPPNELYSKSAEIALIHGRHEAVGWTTPNWTFQDPVVAPDGTWVRLQAQLSFLMDLPSDYDEGAKAVVRDHEMGHVAIAKRKAKEILQDELKTKIEALTDVSTDTVANEVRSAMGRARDEEKKASKSFDDAEYPAMIERYKGLRKSLAELSKSSAAIAAAARAVKRVPGLAHAVHTGDFMGVMSIQEGLTRARGSLSAAEAARLQYNKEFQALVSSASASATELKASMELLPGIGESETFLPQVTGVLATLGTFGYSGEAAAAPF